MAENIYELFPPCFLITYFIQCICVWYRINVYGEGGVERRREQLKDWVSIKCLGC